MVDINKLVESYYPEDLKWHEMLHLIEEVLGADLFNKNSALLEIRPQPSPERPLPLAQETAELTYEAIPEIPISELGWASLFTREGAGSPQRAQLARFLKNIEMGGDLQQKIQRLAAFYSADKEVIKELKSADDTETIKKTLGYLTFYKTLTTIITNFNAASAGFAFESFLGVLLGGTQIATGNKTIADLTAGDGTPISLKLYAEKTVHVGGSYTDLVNDLVRAPYLMQYVVVMKDLTGKALNLEGTLKFYRFNFTLDNVYDVLGNSRDFSVLQLPSQFVSNPKKFDIKLPEYMSIEQAEEIFSNLIKEGIPDPLLAEKLLQTINWANNTQIFAAPKRRAGFGKIGVGQGGRRWRPRGNLKITLDEFASAGHIDPSEVLDYHELIYAANEVVREKFVEVAQQRRELVNRVLRGSFASFDQSQKFYKKLSPEMKMFALQVSRGYIYTDQFNMNRRDVVWVKDSALPEGQDSVKIGEIEIGTEKIKRMLNSVRDLINTTIFDIFNSLKILTVSIHAYFAGGMEDNAQAEQAIVAAAQIGEKTTEIKSEK